MRVAALSGLRESNGGSSRLPKTLRKHHRGVFRSRRKCIIACAYGAGEPIAKRGGARISGFGVVEQVGFRSGAAVICYRLCVGFLLECEHFSRLAESLCASFPR